MTNPIAGRWFLPVLPEDHIQPVGVLANPGPGNNAHCYCAIGVPSCPAEAGEYENYASPCGAFDPGGNLWQWNEANVLG